MKITAARLRKEQACEKELAIFEREWPNGVVISREVLLRAVELGLNVSWAATVLLPFGLFNEFADRSAPFQRAYDNSTSPFRFALFAKSKAARENPFAGKESLGQQLAYLDQEYRDAVREPRRVYQTAVAEIFARLVEENNL
jgi:hypothetical protein